MRTQTSFIPVTNLAALRPLNLLMKMNMKRPDQISQEAKKLQILAGGHVVPQSERCVQCGICSYNCPINIDVRRHAWLGEPIIDSHCLTCGECVLRCPRGVLQFEHTNLFK
jgi:heterodisulfide reductase subunit C